ncbi:MAG: bifunctional 2-C-methyl-D-erythritol 4-phosphate cytidylyltransferase/2-C-methyl-D-erythritol 2,4-cyclodiphosphate synthase [Alphaproteobacteria bacterium]|nr:bifunctional 2-C-methyl-D-erythritol 4-phosphate cytidylyltransferase/2-C-methyl-D-erythritol 2,4-cyclodiphosphate synthase [Alphaproteobacteria bacterium]
MSQPKIAALIVAAGSGTRAGGALPKQYQQLAGKPMLAHSAQTLVNHPAISNVLVVISSEHEDLYTLDVPYSHGGKERQDSVRLGLEALAKHAPDYVLIHDAARPFLSTTVIDNIVAALGNDAVIPALSVADTIRTRDGATIDRNTLLRIQTPQAFPFAKILELHQKNKIAATDDAELWLQAGGKIVYVEGEERNRKMTTAEDMRMPITKIGMGYDVHKLIDGDAIILGGVKIPHTKKLEGHSDADVVLHAIVDAILGALGEGDIGVHFPPSDTKWKGADSAKFVEHVRDLLAQKHATLNHLDVTIICEAPKITPHREAMRTRIAQLLGTDISAISVKATTTEGLGFTGRGEGIAAQAVATVSIA